MMNKATRKAFLVLFVVCVIVIAIAYYLAIKGLSLAPSLLRRSPVNYWQLASSAILL